MENIEALILISDIDTDIVTHHLGISISKNRQTILNIGVSNTKYYGQPIKARDNVQVFHNTLAILKI